eukprot:TRINITY_DN14591_c0_g1_i2.p1 TRINITY_DN14591_c0_g1~~TRINITY_DN14591_c0_g1_i2.p1  ORF type:complete len:446 (-),score=102.12 TRINITY_DN14591_c0_g1_i2:110-1318(-)
MLRSLVGSEMCIRDSINAEYGTPRQTQMRVARALGPVQSRSCSTMASADSVIVDRLGSMRLVTLNRPKALNALNLEMIRGMYPMYQEWQANAGVSMIVQQGAGTKAFCAGGDVAALYKSKVNGEGEPGVTSNFFQEEYKLNHLIGSSNKPVISLLDGITMGGGVGLSVHGDFRIVTERSMFAMPETAIGLFPDVGGSHFLPRLPGQIGMFLALTGARLRAADLIYSRIGTHFVPSDRLEELIDRLQQLEAPAHMMRESIELALSEVEDTPEGHFTLQEHRDKIDGLFSGETVEQILAGLDADGTEWATKQAGLLRKMSPTSLKITHRQIREGASKDLAECLQMEYDMTQACMANKDFFEGVRAVLIDKDNTPVWHPTELDQVSVSDVDAYFQAAANALTFDE